MNDEGQGMKKNSQTCRKFIELNNILKGLMDLMENIQDMEDPKKIEELLLVKLNFQKITEEGRA